MDYFDGVIPSTLLTTPWKQVAALANGWLILQQETLEELFTAHLNIKVYAQHVR